MIALFSILPDGSRHSISRFAAVVIGVLVLHLAVAGLLLNMPAVKPVAPVPVPPMTIRWVEPSPPRKPAVAQVIASKAPAVAAPQLVAVTEQPVEQPVEQAIEKPVTAAPIKPVMSPRSTPISAPSTSVIAAFAPANQVAPATVAASPVDVPISAPVDLPIQATAIQPVPTSPEISTTTRPKTVQGVAYRHPPELNYPESARDRGEEGNVLLLLLIDREGRVIEAKIQRSSGSRLLDQAALKMAEKTSFHPYRENGVAQPVYVPMPLEFKLDEE